MGIFSNKKGFIQHPGVMMAIAFVLGLAAAYLWINYTTIANPFCK